MAPGDRFICPIRQRTRWPHLRQTELRMISTLDLFACTRVIIICDQFDWFRKTKFGGRKGAWAFHKENKTGKARIMSRLFQTMHKYLFVSEQREEEKKNTHRTRPSLAGVSFSLGFRVVCFSLFTLFRPFDGMMKEKCSERRTEEDRGMATTIQQ